MNKTIFPDVSRGVVEIPHLFVWKENVSMGFIDMPVERDVSREHSY